MQEDPNGIQQVVFYDPGVGLSTDAVHAHSLTEKLSGGILGHGLDTNVKQLYTSIALNYDPGDELYLFGFSRGAYTVRSLAGLIHACGIVPRHRLHDVHEAYEAYRSGNPMRVYFFRKGERTEIAALVCFDTVGALGVPKTVFGWELPDRWREKYQFHDVTVNESVRNAVHVLSIDEDRAGKYLSVYFHSAITEDDVSQDRFSSGHITGFFRDLCSVIVGRCDERP